MNDPSSTEVEVVQLTEDADGLYVFDLGTDARRFAAAADLAGKTCAKTTEPVFSDPAVVDELVTTIADGAEWPESLVGRVVEDEDGRRFPALSLDTKDGRATVGDDADWEYADLVRVVDQHGGDPEPAYTVAGLLRQDGRPYVLTVYTHNGPSAAIDIAERCCAEEQGVADAGLSVFAVFSGDPAYLDIQG